MIPTPELTTLFAQAARTKTAEDLWRLMLCEDPVYRKIPEHLRPEAVFRAAAFGRKAIEGLAERFGTRGPGTIARGLGAQVVLSQEPHVFGKVVRTSTYAHRSRTITIFTGAVDEMNRMLSEELGGVLGLRDVAPVYLAHELFHHLEEDRLGRAANCLQITTLKLGPLVLRSGIGQMSEIAADAFSQALLGLRTAPRLLDYVTVWIHNPEASLRRLRALVNG